MVSILSAEAPIEEEVIATIGGRIRFARKEFGLNQSELAERLGVSQPTVANWESGIHDPRRLMLAKLSETLKVPLAWLSGGARSEAERDKQAAAAYLRRFIQHVPVISYENAVRFLRDNLTDPHSYAEDYIPVTSGESRLFAIFVNDNVVDMMFPPDTLLVIDYSDLKPSDGNFCLARVDGHTTIRRWYSDPGRLEPFSNDESYETLYTNGVGKIIGCVRVSIRFH